MGVERLSLLTLSLLSNCQNTLIKHAFLTNQSAHYVWTLLYTHLTLAWTIDKGRGLHITHKIFFLACEQALRGALAAGREKEGELAPTCLEFEYLHRKSRCEKLIGGDDISNDLSRVFQCLFTFPLVSASLWLAEIWQLNRRGFTGELVAKFKFQKRSCKLSFLCPPRRQSTPDSLLVGYIFLGYLDLLSARILLTFGCYCVRRV